MGDDAISRQAAIDELKTRRDSAKDWYDKASADGDEMIIARADSAMMSFIESILTMKKLPSVQPRKKGKWVRALDGIPGHVRCDKCFKIYDWDKQAQYYDFCPNCGTDMRGEQDATD